MHGTDVVALISVFGFLSFLVYMFFSTRHKERMSLIENSKDASLFANNTPGHYSTLKWGLLLVSLGIGLGIGLGFDVSMNNEGPLVTFPTVFVFGGLGLLAYYNMVKNRLND